ncbi:MAG: zinc ribbon domain-containing protein, partial [Lachnospiraceae bacterium]|nr:zinc ribbon domain-containing protein [Lachnospiraceae bacterium]
MKSHQHSNGEYAKGSKYNRYPGRHILSSLIISSPWVKGETVFCRHCGTKLDDNALFCHYCGTRINMR